MGTSSVFHAHALARRTLRNRMHRTELLPAAGAIARVIGLPEDVSQ